MTNLSISNEIRRFILNSIPSVSYLEAMLLMRSVKDHDWTVEELSKRLFINESATETILKQLQGTGIIKMINNEMPLYRYEPQTPELKNLIDQIAILYSSHLIEITNLIHSNIGKKAHKFANAFIWRKDS
ncbi:Uncharacterised protein [Legionella wadsworthii]|uniref:Uncharacterized protein n=2 Tax=Legionella wadsworthii TaxID=28088 RepID=A0A378LQV9_9GAMM|nr:Uncharacterised protein [Legionella wadsworthii]